MRTYEASYSFNVRRHLAVPFVSSCDESAIRIARAAAMAHIEAELLTFQNRAGFSDTEPLDPYLTLDAIDPVEGTDVICEEAVPDPQALDKPLPIDLIVAARGVVAAYGGDVPDWLQNEIGMLELALKPFADAELPVPAEPFTSEDIRGWPERQA